MLPRSSAPASGSPARPVLRHRPRPSYPHGGISGLSGLYTHRAALLYRGAPAAPAGRVGHCQGHRRGRVCFTAAPLTTTHIPHALSNLDTSCQD